MANGHVEIHDPFSNHNNLTTSSSSEPRSTSDTNGMDDTVEFRLLMAYAKRRRPKRGAASPPRHTLVAKMGDLGPSSSQTPAETKKEEEEEGKTQEKKKKKKGGNRLLKILSCIKPKIKDEEVTERVANKPDADDRCFFGEGACSDA